jgi:hypothetical protein
MASHGATDYDELNARLMGVSAKSILYYKAKHHDDLASEVASLHREVVEGRLRTASLEVESLDLKRQVGSLAHSLGSMKDQLRRKDERLQALEAKEVERVELGKGLERKAEAVAAATIEEERGKAWEKWFNERVVPLASQLDQEFKADALSFLRAPFTLTCLAGHSNVHSFTAKEWDELLRTGITKFACGQPGCLHGAVGPATGIEVRSQWLIQILLTSAQPRPPERDPNVPVA